MDLHQLDNWQSIWRALIALGLICFPAYILGQWLSPRSSSRWLWIVVGFNCLGALGLAIGFLPAPLPVVILAVIFLFSAIRWILTGMARSDFAELRLASGGFRTWRQFLALAVIALTLGPALTYPTGWDELAYHIELPRRWSTTGAITIQGDLPYSALPSLFEIICTLVYPVEGLVAPRLLIWLQWICGASLLVQLLKQLSSAENGTVLSASVIASPISLMVSQNCYVEVLIWSNCIAILYLLLNEKFLNQRSFIPLLAILIAGAIATKMTSVGLLLLPVFLKLCKRNQDQPQSQPGSLLLVLFGAVVCAAPFYLRSWWYCGNPVSPYYAQLFTTSPQLIATSNYHHELAIENFGMSGWIGRLAAPIAIAFANELYDGHFGYQWFILLGLGIHSLRFNKATARRDTLWLGLSTLTVGCVWVISSQQARFAIPLYLLVAVLALKGLSKLADRTQYLLRLVILATTLMSLPWNNLGYYLDSWLCVLKVRPPVEYIRDGILEDGYIELTEYLNKQVRPNERVLSLFEHRLAYLPSQVEIGTPYFQSKFFTKAQSQTAPELIDELRTLGINYLVITARPIGPDVSSSYIRLQQDWYRTLDSCIADGSLSIIWRSGEYAVVKVNQVDGAGSATTNK